MSEWIVDAFDRDFEAVVLERSKSVPVVVDFWAPWCGPCRALGPLLEQLAGEYQGEFILAKVNVDENPNLAAALNVRSIPMVLGFRDGRIVAEFVGALPEAAVRQFLTKVLPSDAERLAAAAEASLEGGNVADAEATFQQALQLDPRCDRALLGMATIRARRDEHAEALQLLDRVAPGPLRDAADRLAAEIRVKNAGAGDEATLRAKLAAQPDDLATRLALGQALAAAAQYEAALAEYLEVVRRDRKYADEAARKAMVDIFNLLGADNEITGRYRSELAKVLFS
jgi:putative thioredoxin